MKFPNFRVYETQATTAMILGVLGLAGIAMLTLFVFWGFVADQMVIVYDPAGARGQFRKALVFMTAALSMVVAVVAALMGFNSLGQARNTKQGRSWLGMTLGAVNFAAALVLLVAWLRLSEPVIKALE